MATAGVLGIHIHTREVEVRNTRIQALTHRSTRALQLRTHSISLLLTLNLHILELVISGTLTRLQPSIRRNITSISISKRRNETIAATGNIAVNAMILSLQQILRITLVITRNQSILRGQRSRVNRIPVQHRTSLTVALQTQSHIGRIGTAGQLRTQLGRIQIKRLAGTVSTNTGQLRRRNRQVTRGQISRCLTHGLHGSLNLGIKGVLVESQGRDVVQALMGNAARGGMRMSCGNHDVRFRVFRSILGADTLDQLISERLPASESIQHHDEVTLTAGTVNSNKGASILTGMHAATLLGSLAVAHETDLAGFTGNIGCAGTHEVGRGLGGLSRGGRPGHLAGRQNCGGGNQAGGAHTCQRSLGHDES